MILVFEMVFMSFDNKSLRNVLGFIAGDARLSQTISEYPRQVYYSFMTPRLSERNCYIVKTPLASLVSYSQKRSEYNLNKT